MRVSIITATYNSASTIRDTLESIKRQDHLDVEHIIIDGLSKDSTAEIVASYPHVSQYISEKDNGIYDAMNKGIKLATGDILGILNSDDFYANEQVLSTVAGIFRDKDCDAVYGDLQYVDKEDVTRVVRHWHSGKYSPAAFKWGWMPPHPTFFVKRSLYERLGTFNLDMKTAADYELMLRFIHKHNIKLEYLPSVLVKMRMGGASNANILSRLRANREDKQAWATNGLQPFWFTLYLKPLRKLSQYIFK
jgi:glycosyltransferase involved in cell wall biosynthesis